MKRELRGGAYAVEVLLHTKAQIPVLVQGDLHSWSAFSLLPLTAGLCCQSLDGQNTPLERLCFGTRVFPFSHDHFMASGQFVPPECFLFLNKMKEYMLSM